MLVLTRRKDESFFIGDDVKITIMDYSYNMVKVGITAPPEVKITRSENRDMESPKHNIAEGCMVGKNTGRTS